MNTVPPSPLPEDSELVASHLAGDPQAFRRIVERYQGMVCALAYSACGDLARSEDLAQEVFVAAWKQLPHLRDPRKLRGWLGGITRNLAHNSLRQARRMPTAGAQELPVDVAAEAAGPREQAIGADEAGLMWQALGALPEIYREPMVLFYREGQSVALLAATLELSEDAAKQRLVRGRAMLTERMAELVRETLERSAPTPAFAAAVLVLVPGPLTPMLLEAVESNAGFAGKTLATAGVVGGVVSKGGVAVKLLSALVFLPALMQGAGDFIQFQDRNAAQPEGANRREAAWSYLMMNAGIGLFCFGVVVVPSFFAEPTSPWIMGPVFLWACGSLWVARRAKCRMKRLMPKGPEGVVWRGFERRSPGLWFGLPFYHIRLGTRPSGKSPAVKAWIAISDDWALGGLFAFGPRAVAPISMGIVSFGILSVGMLAIGGGALGVLALGWLSSGLVAIAGLAAKGVVVAAPLVASNAAGFGGREGAEVARAFFQHNWFYHFTAMATKTLIWAGLLGWVMPVVLTAWQLWRTRHSSPAS